MSHVTHWVPLEASGAIGAYRLVDAAGAEGGGDTSTLIGVSGSRAVADDETVEVAIAGIADVEYGAAVTAGALLTSDSDGKAVPTTTAGKRIAGIAMTAGADGDIGEILISPGSV